MKNVRLLLKFVKCSRFENHAFMFFSFPFLSIYYFSNETETRPNVLEAAHEPASNIQLIRNNKSSFETRRLLLPDRRYAVIKELKRMSVIEIFLFLFQPCMVCSKQFPNLPKLQRHMANHADGPDLRKFKCSRCGKAFKFKHHLKVRPKSFNGIVVVK